VFSPSGRQVAGPVVKLGPQLASPLEATEAGTYVVSWQVFASDTHPSRGVFSFAVGRTSGNPYSALLDEAQAGTSTPLGLALQAIARWVHFAGFAFAFGVVAYGVLLRRLAAPRRLVTTGAVLLIAAEPIALVAQLASLSFDGDTAVALLGSTFGRLLGLRLGAALLTWALAATGWAWPILAVGAVDAVLDGASAHAIPGLPGAGTILVAAHVGAMGMWVGGLAAFVAAPDRRFARFAVWTLGIAVTSGILLALAHTHLNGVLVTTDYGRVLLLKAVLVAAALLAAALGRQRRELAMALLVVAMAALVAALPPPF
jgi:copper transport protein